MACVLRPSRFISRNSCMSLPLSTLGPPPSEDRPAHTLIRGWGIFNRLYGDFCTGADTVNQSGKPSPLPFPFTVHFAVHPTTDSTYHTGPSLGRTQAPVGAWAEALFP